MDGDEQSQIKQDDFQTKKTMIKPSKRLQTVLKLAKLRQQRAAEQLAEKQRVVDAHKQQMKQLETYQNEYNTTFEDRGKQPVSPLQLNNYLKFFNNLAHAIDTQNKSETDAQIKLEQSRCQWQQLYCAQKNMEVLINVKRQKEDKEEENKVQRILDDSVVVNKDTFL